MNIQHEIKLLKNQNLHANTLKDANDITFQHPDIFGKIQKKSIV